MRQGGGCGSPEALRERQLGALVSFSHKNINLYQVRMGYPDASCRSTGITGALRALRPFCRHEVNLFVGFLHYRVCLPRPHQGRALSVYAAVEGVACCTRGVPLWRR